MEGAGTEGPREDTLAYGHENHGLSLWCRSSGVPPPTMLFLVLKSTAQCMEGEDCLFLALISLKE